MLLPHSRSSIANPRRHFVENRNLFGRKARVTSRLPNAGFSWLRKHHGSRAAMSALGQKQTLERASGMSALPPRADITQPVGPTNVLSSSAVPMDVVFELLDNELLITDYALHQVANRNYSSQASMFEHREMSHHLCGHLSHAFLN